jgi:acetyltransferase
VTSGSALLPRPTAANDVRAAALAAIATIAPEIDVATLRPDQPLRDQVDLDSIDWVNVIAGLCERLSIDIPDADYGRLSTIDAIVAYIGARQTPAPAPKSPPPESPAAVELPVSRHVIAGTPVTIRPIGPGDADLEEAFVEHLSKASRYERFMVTLRELPPPKLTYMTEVDQVRHVAFVAVTEQNSLEVIVGAVRYVLLDAGDRCEFAVVVDDAWKRTGLAGLLMHVLMDTARRRGVATVEGTVLATNHTMLKFMHALGFRMERLADDPQSVHVIRNLW